LRLRATVTAATATVIAVLAGFLAYALVQADLARKEKARALDLARVSTAGEWLDKDPTKAALVLLEVEDPVNTHFASRRMSEVLNRGFVGAEYGHDGPVHSVAVNADGSRVLTSSDNLAMVWETFTGRILRRLQHNETVIDGSFDPTGRFVVTRAGKMGRLYTDDRTGGTAWVWDLETGKQQFTVSHDEKLNVAVFSPKGRFLATASNDHTAQLWDTEGSKLQFTLKHDDDVSDVSFSPDGRMLVTASGKTAQLWSVETGEKGFSLSHNHSVSGASFSPDRSRLVTMGSGQVFVWHSKRGTKQHTLDHRFVRTASFSADGRYLLTAADSTVQVWNVNSKAGWKNFRDPIVHENLMAASFSQDGALVITVSGHKDRKGYDVSRADNAVRFWDARTGEERFAKNLKLNGEVMTVAFGPGHKFAVANSAARVGSGRYNMLLENTTVRLWNVETRDRRVRHALKHDHRVVSASFSPNGRWLLTVAGNAVRLWYVESGEGKFTLNHDKDVTAASFGPNGRLVVTASKDKTARLWDVETGAQRFMIRHNSDVKDSWLIASGKLMVTVSDRTLRLWNSKTGSAKDGDELFELPLKGYGKVSSDSFSPDGKLLVAVSGKTTQVWDVEKREKPFTLQHEGQVLSTAFAANGRLLVTEEHGGDNIENIVRANRSSRLETPPMHTLFWSAPMAGPS
jgi:WD40 repeat protein